MQKLMRKIIAEYPDAFFEAYIIPYIKANGKTLFSDVDKNLCLEHYNYLHKTSFAENDIELNPNECWLCKQIKDRP